MSRVVLSTAARLDRREITAYTVRRFGIRSARQVRDRFQTALNAPRVDPEVLRTYPAFVDWSKKTNAPSPGQKEAAI